MENLSDLTALTDILKVFRKVGIFCDVGEFLMIRDIFKN